MKQRFIKLASAALAIAAVLLGTHASAQEGSITAVSQRTVVVVSTPQPNEPAEAVVFYMIDDRQTVAPGELVTFRVVVRNQRNTDINGVRIMARIPDFIIPTETAPESDVNPAQRTITWNNMNLKARAEQTYAIRAQVAPEAPLGQSLKTVAEISGPGVRGSFTDVSTVETKISRITDQAAITTAPTTPVAPPRPKPVVTTARTGAATNSLLAMTLLGGLSLFWQRKSFSA